MEVLVILGFKVTFCIFSTSIYISFFNSVVLLQERYVCKLKMCKPINEGEDQTCEGIDCLPLI